MQAFIPTLSSFSLAGKMAVITGGARGFGFAMSKALVLSGANLAIVDLNSKFPSSYSSKRLICTDTLHSCRTRGRESSVTWSNTCMTHMLLAESSSTLYTSHVALPSHVYKPHRRPPWPSDRIITSFSLLCMVELSFPHRDIKQRP